MQTKFEWRMGSGVSVLNSLTLSETKDNGAGSLENTAGNFPAPQDFNNLEADFGLGAYHQPFNNTTSLVLDIPVGSGRTFLSNASPVLDALVGGWQVALINSYYAGQTVTLTYTPSNAFLVSGIQQDFRGANNYRPNVVGEVVVPKDQRSVSRWFDPAAVVIPTDPSQPFGNAPRNAYRGPSIVQTDFAASKRFRMPWRDGGLEFRAEVFNLFNRANFLPPNGNRSSAAFGTITGTLDPRIIQFGLKATF
jgi:hypothetical protein